MPIHSNERRGRTQNVHGLFRYLAVTVTLNHHKLKGFSKERSKGEEGGILMMRSEEGVRQFAKCS